MSQYRNKHDINPPEPCTSVFYSAVRCKFWPYFSIDHFSAVSSVVPTAYLYPSIAHCDTALQCFKGTVQFPSPSDFGLFFWSFMIFCPSVQNPIDLFTKIKILRFFNFSLHQVVQTFFWRGAGRLRAHKRIATKKLCLPLVKNRRGSMRGESRRKRPVVTPDWSRFSKSLRRTLELIKRSRSGCCRALLGHLISPLVFLQSSVGSYQSKLHRVSGGNVSDGG